MPARQHENNPQISDRLQADAVSLKELKRIPALLKLYTIGQNVRSASVPRVHRASSFRNTFSCKPCERFAAFSIGSALRGIGVGGKHTCVV